MSDPHSTDVDYLFGSGPEPGQPMEVAPGLLWVRVPLPIRLRIVNVWLAEGADGWTIVDTGFNNADTIALWQALAGRFRFSRLICTHYHPDHAGLSGWMERHWGLSPHMTLPEWLVHYMLARMSPAQFVALQDSFYRRYGMGQTLRGRFRTAGNPYRRGVIRAADRFTRLEPGQTLELAGSDWTLIRGRGHSVEHASFLRQDGQVLIAGDQILPKITPNTSLFWYLDGMDPLGDYLASFAAFDHLGDDVLVLPSHRDPFRGLARRIATLRAHHEERLSHVLAAFRDREPMDCEAVTRSLFPMDLDLHQTTFAFGEALAHLVHLVRRGALEQIAEAAGGPVLFRPV